MICPECGSQQADGTAICDACDAILDPSFLGEDAPEFDDDEGTDPGIEAPPAPSADEGGTQIVAASEVVSSREKDVDEGTENFDSAEAGTYVGAAPEPARPAGPPPEVPEDDGEYEYEYEDEEEEAWEEEPAPPPPRPSADSFNYRDYMEEHPEPAEPAEPAAPPPPVSAGRSRGGAVGRGRGGAPSPAVSPSTDSGGIKGALEFDTSSQMMDDYEAMMRKTWEGFMALPVTEKVSIIGASLAALTVLFPWRIDVSPAGVADESIGLVGMGWVGLLLAGSALGLTWYRLTQPGAAEKAKTLALAGVGICGAGLLWSIVSLGAAATGGNTMVGNPHGVTPGPGYGLFMHLVAWTVAGIGAVVSLKDLPTGRRRR